MARVGSLKFIKVTRPCLAHSISFISQKKPTSNIKTTLSCSSTAFGLHTTPIPSRLLIFKNFCTTNNNAQTIQPNTENVSQSYVDDNLAKLKLMLKKEKYGSVAGAMFHMRKEKKPLTTEHYKIAIESYSHLRKSKEILNLLEEMSQNNMIITITEYNFLLKSVLMELQDHKETINIKKMIEDAGYKLDAFSYGILMHSAIIGLEHSKHIMESRALLQEMKERRVRPNLQFYEEVIRSYHHRNAKSIIYWYKKMVENGFKPPRDILSIIKNAFIRLGMREELQEFMTNVWNTTDWGEGSGPRALDLANKLDTEFITPQKVQSQDDVLSEEKEASQMEELTK